MSEEEHVPYADTRIPLADLQDRHIYRIVSRNLGIGVFRAESSGYIGIREKFHDHYLFEEYDYLTGGSFGTATPLEDLGVLPDDIEATETVELGCTNCGGDIQYHEELRGELNKETREWSSWPWVCENGCTKDANGHHVSGSRGTYKPLFEYLMAMDPFLDRCGECEKIIMFFTPWDAEGEGFWTHMAPFTRGRPVDEEDHAPVTKKGTPPKRRGPHDDV